MKKFLLSLGAIIAFAGFASEAKAELNLSIGFGLPLPIYRSCDDGYTRVYRRPVVTCYDAPVYYQPRRVVYYDAPVYRERRSYRHHRGYR